uniref:Uncharacterized protein n=1 Tax=Aegilops tauschii subsp. strangulata TaxID=200361 RepID=A0A453E6H3_AEGTS
LSQVVTYPTLQCCKNSYNLFRCNSQLVHLLRTRQSQKVPVKKCH